MEETVFADLEDSMVSDWQHPIPVTQLHHVEAAMMEWGKERSKLRKLKRMMVDDPVVAKAPLEQLLGGVRRWRVRQQLGIRTGFLIQEEVCEAQF